MTKRPSLLKNELKTDLLCEFEDPEESSASKHREAHWIEKVIVSDNDLQNRCDDDEEVESIEDHGEVVLQAVGTHLENHLQGEETHKEDVGKI